MEGRIKLVLRTGRGSNGFGDRSKQEDRVKKFIDLKDLKPFNT